MLGWGYDLLFECDNQLSRQNNGESPDYVLLVAIPFSAETQIPSRILRSDTNEYSMFIRCSVKYGTRGINHRE